MFISHYNINDKYRLIAILVTGESGIVTEYSCDKDYIDILFHNDTYAKSVPISDIKTILPKEI